MIIGEFEGKPLNGVRVDGDDVIFTIGDESQELSRFQTYTFSVGEYPYEWDNNALKEFRASAQAKTNKKSRVSLV
jgi:hypothetical protein